MHNISLSFVDLSRVRNLQVSLLGSWLQGYESHATGATPSLRRAFMHEKAGDILTLVARFPEAIDEYLASLKLLKVLRVEGDDWSRVKDKARSCLAGSAERVTGL